MIGAPLGKKQRRTKDDRMDIQRTDEQERPFLDPPNTAVITSVRILDGQEWVQYVSHDEEDGAWQFHPLQDHPEMENAAVVALHRMIEIEPRLLELADLPLGWQAWRESKDAEWIRAPQSE